MTNDLESRIRTIERLLGLGISHGIDTLQEDIRRVEEKANRALSNYEVGNVAYGGPIRTQNAGNFFTSGPYIRDVSTGFPAEFDIVIHGSIIRLKEVVIRIKPRAIRSSVSDSTDNAGTPSGGGATSGSGGASTPTSSGGSSHTHSMTGALGNTSTGLSVSAHNIQTTDDNPDTPHHHLAQSAQGTGHTVNESAHTHSLNTLATVGESSHTHTVTIAAHDHSTPNHVHPNHFHPLLLQIAEAGGATSLSLLIDGTDRTAALGGPWSAAASLDITTYLLDSGKPRLPVAGVHTIRITSTNPASVEAWIDWLTIISPVRTD